jgi:transposase
MKHIRTIMQTRLRLPEASIRQIAAISRCSRPIVSQYLELFREHPLDEAMLSGLSDIQLAQHLGIEPRSIQETDQNRRLSAWLDEHGERMHDKHMTRRLLHELYTGAVEDPLQYSQFCVVLKQRYQDPEASGMFDHKAGDKLYIDFTGDKYHWREENGPAHVEEVYLSVLGASARFYALPVPNQRQETFCSATQAAFQHFGGVPHAVVPDCLKSAVLSHDGYEPVHNPLFARLLAHYHVVSIPARPRRPRDKPLAETTVKLIYTRMLAKLDNRVFPSRQAMLEAWMVELRAVNAAPFQRLPGSRQSRFESIDKPALSPLPERPFTLTEILTQTIRNTLAVYVPADQTSYSVPAGLQGKTVEVIVNPEEIEIWQGNERFATHKRSPGSGKVIDTEHLPATQRWYATRNPAELVRALQSHGHHAGRWAQEVLSRAEHEDIAWRILDGLRCLATKSPAVIDRVCRMALSRELYTLKAVRALVTSGEVEAELELEEHTVELPFHENIRGGEYFTGEVVR